MTVTFYVASWMGMVALGWFARDWRETTFVILGYACGVIVGVWA